MINIYMKTIYDSTKKKEIIDYYIKHTAPETHLKYNICTNIVAKWIRQAGMKCKKKQNLETSNKLAEQYKKECLKQKCSTISEELKKEILEYVKNHTWKLACAKYNIGPTTIANWINPETFRKNIERSKKWFENNPERHQQLLLKRRQKVKEMEKLDIKFKEQRLDYSKNYYKDRYTNDPSYKKDMFERHITSNRKRRAMRVNVKENYTKEDDNYTRQLFNNKCAICGALSNLEIDHWKPLSKGNPLTRQNAVLLCESCNSSKGDKNPEEYYDKIIIELIEQKLK